MASRSRSQVRGSSVALGLCLLSLAWLACGLACGARSGLGTLDGGPFPGSPPGDAATPDVAAAVDGPGDAASPDACAGMPPVPCPRGGYEYCVDGRYSECPKRCGLCVPGSTRVCFLTYCNRWGTQTCAADGLSFGFCVEGPAPSKCAAIGEQLGTAPELEQCCVDGGFCCEDWFDLNGDGNNGDSIGSCNGTSC